MKLTTLLKPRLVERRIDTGGDTFLGTCLYFSWECGGGGGGGGGGRGNVHKTRDRWEEERKIETADMPITYKCPIEKEGS